MKKLKVLSLFAGIGAFEKALSNINIDFELVGYSEIDEKVSRAYSKIHNIPESLNLGDIQLVDESSLPKFDLMTWGFPCTNFTNCRRDKATKRLGLKNEASGLFYDGLRVLKENKPTFSVIENVPDLLSNKFKDQFQEILDSLTECGYVNTYAVLNAADYNTPQNRNRLFIVSIRKDIYRGFEFQPPTALNCKVSDFLDDFSEIDDRFKKINPSIIEKVKSRRLRSYDICPTITKAIGRAGSSSEYISNCSLIYQNTGNLRRMTPKETMLLSGFDVIDYENAKSVSSNSQIYNFTGNTICVRVLEKIFENLFVKFNYLNDLNSTLVSFEVIETKSNCTQLMFALD